MGVSATWSVFCDECSQWFANEPTKDRAKRAALDAGFVRRRTEDGGPYQWLCPESRDDVCGESYTYIGGGGSSQGLTQWCLRPPDHKGKHSWSDR